MVEAGTTIFALALVMTMATLGAVLLMRFFMKKADTSTRTFMAALLGPGLVLLPVSAFVFLADQGGIEGILGIFIILLLLFAMIGYPVSHFATRRLDKLTRFNADTFK
ncbi:MAG: hypothetical protein AAF941_01360 [Pseudomonadota bacterium]